MIVDVLFEPNAYILNALTNDDHLTISTRPKYVMCHCFYIILNLFFFALKAQARQLNLKSQNMINLLKTYLLISS